MPLVRVDIPAGKPAGDIAAFGGAVQQALHDTMGVPLEERFHVFTEHRRTTLSVDPNYLGIARSADAVIVQVFLNAGRDPQTKARFYAALVSGAAEAVELRPEDIVINLVEVSKADWSFGNGEAQLTTTGG